MRILGHLKLMLCIGLPLFLLACTQDWSRKSVEQSLTVAIPSDARHVTYSGHPLELNLRFEAPPQSALSFAAQFCSGQLIQGFDPFHALIADDSGHPIDMGYYVYYASSQGTANTLYGIRCPFFRLTVDESGEDTYSVHLLQEFHHHDPDEVPAEYTGTPFEVPAG